MIIVMKKNATREQIDHVIEWIESVGYKPHPSIGVERTIIGALGDDRGKAQLKAAELLPGVEKTVPILKPYKLAGTEVKEGKTVIKVGDVEIGNGRFTIIAGPCSIEGDEQLMESAYIVKKGGADILRAGAFKPRTSPYSFQGMEEEGLKLLKKAGEINNIPVVTEVMNTTDVDLVEAYADILQIGARNVQNFSLLKKVGQAKKPVVLKRGMMTTIEELLMSAEYILSSGNPNVILCERGIRTFETMTRNTLDISAVPVLKELTHPARSGRSEPCRRQLEVCPAAVTRRRGRWSRRDHGRGAPGTGKGLLRRTTVAQARKILPARRRGPRTGKAHEDRN